MDRESTAKCGEDCVDTPVQQHRLSSSEPALVGAADTDHHRRSQEGEAFSVIVVMTRRQFPADGVSGGHAWGMSSEDGGDTTTLTSSDPLSAEQPDGTTQPAEMWFILRNIFVTNSRESIYKVIDDIITAKIF